MSFKDYFSGHSSDYARYRPLYPRALFEYLSRQVNEQTTAWDCGTGNGQVAIGLAEFFPHVYASDGSPQQIEQASAHERVEYFVSLAESTHLASNSIDLITVGQAFHWFDPERFYAEAKRVLKPEGILAIWCYGMFNLAESSKQSESLLQQFYQRIEPYWPPERQLVDEHYATISFPFSELNPPNFSMSVEWDMNDLIGYLQTWSATQRYLAAEGPDDIQELFEQLSALWGDSGHLRRKIEWPLYIRVGKK